MKNVTIIADSISMIRPNESIYLNDLYSYKLQLLLKENFYIINNAVRGAYADIQLKNMHNTVLYNDSEIIIIFFGIVDCFPRLFSLREKNIMKIVALLKMGFINKFVSKLKSKYRLFFTKYNKKVYSSYILFQEKYESIIEQINNLENTKQIILINIGSPNEISTNRNFHLDENIIEYNELIKQISKKYFKTKIIDFYTISKENPEIMLSDGIHINNKGHDLIAKILYESILKEQAEH